MIVFTEEEYLILMSALSKCHLLNRYVKAGLDVRLNPKNFGFKEMTDEKEFALISKLNDAAQIAWLKENKT